jgi:hypothetical protein
MRERQLIQAVQTVGYDANEGHRAVNKREIILSKTQTLKLWFPLIDWQWRREDCSRAIERAGLPVPGKSACYMCPASKRSEVLTLRRDHPELFAKALEMERLAHRTNRVKRGLGGEANLWADWVQIEDNSPWLDLEPVHVPCGCVD